MEKVDRTLKTDIKLEAAQREGTVELGDELGTELPYYSLPITDDSHKTRAAYHDAVERYKKIITRSGYPYSADFQWISPTKHNEDMQEIEGGSMSLQALYKRRPFMKGLKNLLWKRAYKRIAKKQGLPLRPIPPRPRQLGIRKMIESKVETEPEDLNDTGEEVDGGTILGTIAGFVAPLAIKGIAALGKYIYKKYKERKARKAAEKEAKAKVAQQSKAQVQANIKNMGETMREQLPKTESNQDSAAASGAGEVPTPYQFEQAKKVAENARSKGLVGFPNPLSFPKYPITGGKNTLDMFRDVYSTVRNYLYSTAKHAKIPPKIAIPLVERFVKKEAKRIHGGKAAKIILYSKKKSKKLKKPLTLKKLIQPVLTFNAGSPEEWIQWKRFFERKSAFTPYDIAREQAKIQTNAPTETKGPTELITPPIYSPGDVTIQQPPLSDLWGDSASLVKALKKLDPKYISEVSTDSKGNKIINIRIPSGKGIPSLKMLKEGRKKYLTPDKALRRMWKVLRNNKAMNAEITGNGIEDMISNMISLIGGYTQPGAESFPLSSILQGIGRLLIDQTKKVLPSLGKETLKGLVKSAFGRLVSAFKPKKSIEKVKSQLDEEEQLLESQHEEAQREQEQQEQEELMESPEVLYEEGFQEPEQLTEEEAEEGSGRKKKIGYFATMGGALGFEWLSPIWNASDKLLTPVVQDSKQNPKGSGALSDFFTGSIVPALSSAVAPIARTGLNLLSTYLFKKLMNPAPTQQDIASLQEQSLILKRMMDALKGMPDATPYSPGYPAGVSSALRYAMKSPGESTLRSQLERMYGITYDPLGKRLPAEARAMLRQAEEPFTYEKPARKLEVRQTGVESFPIPTTRGLITGAPTTQARLITEAPGESTRKGKRVVEPEASTSATEASTSATEEVDIASTETEEPSTPARKSRVEVISSLVNIPIERSLSLLKDRKAWAELLYVGLGNDLDISRRYAQDWINALKQDLSDYVIKNGKIIDDLEKRKENSRYYNKKFTSEPIDQVVDKFKLNPITIYAMDEYYRLMREKAQGRGRAQRVGDLAKKMPLKR